MIAARSGCTGLLFPVRPRTFPGRRLAKIVARAVHVTCAGVLVGAHLLDAATDLRQQWLLATVSTGLALLLLDLHESCSMLLQVRGAVVVGKVLVVAALPWLGAARVPALVGLMLAACVTSHAPAQWRYRLLLGRGRLVASTSRG